MVEENKTVKESEKNTPVQKIEPQKTEVTPDIKTPEKPKEEFKPIEIPSEEYLRSPLFYEVANYFNIESKEYQGAADKLSIITEWAINEANSNKLHDILPVIRQLEDKIMRPAWGETRYGNLYRYLRLAMKKDAILKAVGAYEKVPEKK